MDVYKVYRKRWFILLTVTVLNISNSEIWACFACISNIAQEYYKVSANEINMLSMVYFLCCFPAGIFALWFIDYIGMKKGIWLGAWLNAVGASIKFLSCLQFLEGDIKYKVVLLGQVISAMGQMYMYVPTKVAEFWFPPNERTLATSIIGVGNPIGVLFGIGFVPLLVTKPNDIPWLTFISSIFALIGALMSCAITSSTPPSPPSESAEVHETYSFQAALKELFTNKAYILLLMFTGACIGVYGVFVSLLEEILLQQGYSNQFSALCIILMIIFGIFGSIAIGLVLDKTKSFSLSAKILGGIFCFLFDLYAVLLGYPNLQYILAPFAAIIGIFLMSSYTVSLELSVECTFPLVPEATSTGILFIISQLHGTIYFYIMEIFSNNKNHLISQIFNMRFSMLIVAAILTIFCITFIIFFKTEYKRLKEEISKKKTNLLVLELGNSINYGTIQ